MDDAVARLTRLVAPAAEPAVPRKNWKSIFHELGTRLPSDYIELIDRYGGGQVDEYLWVLEPHCVNIHYDLIRSEKERAEAFEMLWRGGEPVPDQMQVPGNRLIPWGSTDNGEFLYWLVGPAQAPDDWTVMVNEARGPEWEHFAMGCAEFLVAVLTHRVESEILSSGFPLMVHVFQPSSTF